MIILCAHILCLDLIKSDYNLIIHENNKASGVEMSKLIYLKHYGLTNRSRIEEIKSRSGTLKVSL